MNKFYLLLPVLLIWTVYFNLSGRTCTNNINSPENKSVSGSSVFSFSIVPASVIPTEVYNLKDIFNAKSDNRLEKLVTEIHPCVYFLTDQRIVVKGDAPIKLEMYVNSIPRLYNNNKAYETVELIKIRINSKEDESTMLDISKLTGFKNLKYILFEYAYPVCGNMTDDTCLKGKTVSKILNNNQDIQILYLLSVPQ